MNTLVKLIQTLREETKYYFIQKNSEDLFSSQVHSIEISSFVNEKVSIEHSIESADLVDCFWVGVEEKWNYPLHEAKKIITEIISSWLKNKYELIDENELIKIASDIQKTPVLETRYFDGDEVVRLKKTANQIEINIVKPKDYKIAFTEDDRTCIPHHNKERLELFWKQRVKYFTGNPGLKEVGRADLEETYFLVEEKDIFKRLVFVDNKARDIDCTTYSEKKKDKVIKVHLSDNLFTRHLNDWAYNFCHFAGTEILNIQEDNEIISDDIFPSSGDWVVLDRRGLSGTYGVSHEDHSIYKVKVKKIKEHNVDYKVKPFKRCVSTLDLMHRYKWISFLFDNRTFNISSAHPLWYWKDIATIESAYIREKDHLKDDPHLALYWLMHFGITLDQRYGDVKEMITGMSEHKYLDDCMDFFAVLKKHPNFSAYDAQIYRDDSKEYQHRFEIKRAFALYMINLYEYASDGANIDNWWNAVNIYHKAEQYLIHRVKWLVNNLIKYDAWDKFNQIIKNQSLSDRCLMSYVQFFNPVESGNKKQNATQVLNNTKTNRKFWQKNAEKAIAAEMIYDVHTFVNEKDLLKELLEHYFQNKNSNNYTKIVKYIG